MNIFHVCLLCSIHLITVPNQSNSVGFGKIWHALFTQAQSLECSLGIAPEIATNELMPMLPSLCTKNWQKKSVAWNQMTTATEHAESIATSASNSSMEGCTDFTAASIPSQPYQVQQVRLAHLNHLRSLSPTLDYAWLMGPCNSAWENKVPGIKVSKPLFFVDEIRAFTSSRRAPTVLYRVSRREKSSNKDSHYKAFEKNAKANPSPRVQPRIPSVQKSWPICLYSLEKNQRNNDSQRQSWFGAARNSTNRMNPTWTPDRPHQYHQYMSNCWEKDKQNNWVIEQL